MIVTLAYEKLERIQQEFQYMEATYWYTESEKNSEMPENIWDWGTYFLMEQTGRLMTFTARRAGGLLVGCSFYFIIPPLHHQKHLVASCDSIGVRAGHRGLGIARSLVIFAEHTFKNHVPKINEMTHNVRVRRTSAPLFTSLGFVPFETTYSKRL